MNTGLKPANRFQDCPETVNLMPFKPSLTPSDISYETKQNKNKTMNVQEDKYVKKMDESTGAARWS